MNRGQITINENGTVTVSGDVRMSIAEIADLFGVFHKTAKSAIRAIEKSGVVEGDFSTGATVEGLTIYPDYYGLDMVIALAFRIQSPRAVIFRKWVLRKCITEDRQPIVLQYNYSKFHLSERN